MGLHLNDSYSTTWGESRFSDAGLSSVPSILFDSSLLAVGTNGGVQSTADWYRNGIEQQLAKPTDVTVDVLAVESGNRQYDVTTTVTFDEGAPARNVWVTLVETIDNWPTVDDYWRNTHRRTITDELQVSLQPGVAQSFTETVTYGIESWNNFENIKMIAFAEGEDPDLPYLVVMNAGKHLISEAVENPLDADFNDDGSFDVQDVDLLVAEILSGNDNTDYDLNENGIVNDVDLDEWLTQAATENGFADSFLRGVANLDGTVNSVDLNAIGVNWLTDTGTWSKGDFFVDGTTEAKDLNLLGINWSKTIAQAGSVTAQPVPEPSGLGLLVGALLMLRRRRSRHSE